MLLSLLAQQGRILSCTQGANLGILTEYAPAHIVTAARCWEAEDLQFWAQGPPRPSVRETFRT